MVFRISLSAFLSVAAAASAFSSASDDALASFQSDIEPILDQFCYDCHGYGSDKGGVVLDGFADDAAVRDTTLWLRAFKNLRSGFMPPSDEAQPSEEQKEKVFAWIKEKAFRLDHEQPDPGRVTVRRLNRVEYRNTVRDLLGVDYDTSKEFPADDTGHGFDNNADVLTVSPMLLEKYLDAATAIVQEAVPTESLVVAEQKIAGAKFIAEGERPEDLPAWVRSLSYYEPIVAAARYEVAVAGQYEVVVDLQAIETYVDNEFDYNECRLIFRVDGETLLDRRFAREGWETHSFAFTREWAAGAHDLSFEVVPLTPGENQVRKLRFQLNGVAVRGPLDPKYWVQPRGYERYFPKPVPTETAERRAYARDLLERFASKAYRRPVETRTLERLVDLAEATYERPGASFESGVAQSMIAVIASPRFLFREERVMPLEPGQKYPLIDEYSLASRLSYFLWSTMPDARLVELASRGELRSNLASELQRMLADKKASGFVSNFTGQWLQARDIESVAINSFDVWLRENPDDTLDEARRTFRRLRDIPDGMRTPEQEAALAAARQKFFGVFRAPRPDLTEKLRDAMRSETEMVFHRVLRENRSIVELLDSDYTYLNESLAKHYDIEGVEGEAMRLVQLPEGSPRGGVLTQGTVLAVTSNPTRTSPVKRGVFILENILGAPPPPPPPNIPPLENVASEEDLLGMSLRETLALHASKKTCQSCHERMDPLGLALENFNAMGRWRDREMNEPIEPAGRLITGDEFSGIRELKRILANERRHDFYHCLTEKLLTYALGRGLDYFDIVTLDKLVDQLAANEGRLADLVGSIVESDAFQRTRPIDTHPSSQELVNLRTQNHE